MLIHCESFEQFKEITSKDFVLVDFFATWCGPCRMIAPILEELSEDQAFKPNILKVDVDEISKAAMLYNIQSIPSLLLFKDGKLINSSIGYMRKDQIIQFCNK
ncbi:MAG: thioredoxin [Bacilli bacterium]|nr:thioredoxin [Bacilli bacterium]